MESSSKKTEKLQKPAKMNSGRSFVPGCKAGCSDQTKIQCLPSEVNQEIVKKLRDVGEDIATSSGQWNSGYPSGVVREWHSDLQGKLKCAESATLEVVKGEFQDAKKLFGAKMNSKTKVTLRHSTPVARREKIALLQFDPNFATDEVMCRHTSCRKTNPVAVARGAGKRDLYLCPEHQGILKSYIADSCAKQKVEVPMATEANYSGRFDGYTSLIGLLETAYHDAKTSSSPTGLPHVVQEAILNVRNFLIITSTLLNPNEVNLGIALPPVVQILQLILQHAISATLLLSALSRLLREVIESILFAFGVIFTWVSLALNNPGAQIGAALGGIFGAVGFVIGPWGWAAGIPAGVALGALLGNGIYSLRQERREDAINEFREHWRAANGQGANPGANAPRNPAIYYSQGDAFGGLDLFPSPAVG